jgi:hypothetical protein
MLPCGSGGLFISSACAAQTLPIIKKKISIILIINLFMLSPFFIFHCGAHIAASPFMEGILAGKYGINMEEIRKF